MSNTKPSATAAAANDAMKISTATDNKAQNIDSLKQNPIGTHQQKLQRKSKTNSSIIDDDDSAALDVSEQTMRPPDVALHQQRIPAWHPILDPVWVIIALFYLGVIMVPVGFKIKSMQNNIVEMKFTYDGPDEEDQKCTIGDNYNENRTCLLLFEAAETMIPPILVHYELTNFHQNHRSYFQSRDDLQLRGYVGTQDQLGEQNCGILNRIGDIALNPCGYIANTLFNDYFTLVEGIDAYGEELRMIETGIAWQSDIDYMYRQPDGFKYEECKACDETCCTGSWECGKTGQPYVDKKDGTCYRYVYPDDKKTQYLYETYPDIISPIEGVMNEHFIVWMRVATQPTFRKLYGWINQPIIKGQRVSFRVNANFAVSRFKGSKSLVMSTNNIFGGRNPLLGPLFYWVGFIFLAAGTFFALKHTLRPRKLADSSHLSYKED